MVFLVRGGEFWSDGKYIGTVGDATNEEVIKRYIRNQNISKSEMDRITEQLKLFKV
jgi:putative transposase